MFTLPQSVRIYYEEGTRNIDFKEIKGFIGQDFGISEVYAVRAKKSIVCTKGLIFDIISTWRSFADRREGDVCHVVLTNKLFATLDERGQPHIRAGIYSYPSVISISGIVEGPAKPKEFYIYKQRYSSLGVWDLKKDEVKKRFKRRFIDYDDRRITEVVKGYISQALFFHITGDPFCDRKSCRLYNAHWQEDLIYSQIGQARFCKRHSKMLTGLGKTERSTQ